MGSPESPRKPRYSEQQQAPLPDVATLVTRLDYSTKAILDVRREIRESPSFVPDTATRISVRYLSYLAESISYNRDIALLQDNERVYSTAVSAGVLVFGALHEATEGKYSVAQTVLIKQAEVMAEQKDPDETVKMLALASALPERGAKAELPPPAWMDPKYNPDLEEPKA
jgi:hypothetical protein